MSSGIKENYWFPSGSCSSTLIKLLHLFSPSKQQFSNINKILCRKGFHCEWETKCTLPSNCLHAPWTFCPVKTINKYDLLAFYMKKTNTRKSEKCGMNLYSVTWVKALQLCQYPSTDRNFLHILIWVIDKHIFFSSIREKNYTAYFSDFFFFKSYKKESHKVCEYICKAA